MLQLTINQNFMRTGPIIIDKPGKGLPKIAQTCIAALLDWQHHPPTAYHDIIVHDRIIGMCVSDNGVYYIPLYGITLIDNLT